MDDYVPTENRTLGWIAASWMTEHLVQPDGPDAGQPFELTREQLRILLRWYEIDVQGRFRYRRGVLRRMKGWGKDPFIAAVVWFEALGPCRFSAWGSDGNPIAARHPAPWIQIAAVSKDQTRNTMVLLGPMLGEEAQAAYGVDLGKEIIYFSGGRIEAVTSSPLALEGGRPSFVVLNETQGWLTTNNGTQMAAVIRRNLGKSRDGSARSVAIQNAHVPGMGSVAEADYEAWQRVRDGLAVDTGVYYDATEAPGETTLNVPESLRAGLLAARGDSVWLDVDRLVQEILDGVTTPEESRRFYLNQVVAASDSLVTPSEYDACRVDDRLRPGDAITLGFDGGRSDDATALVACRISDRFFEPIRIWEKDTDFGDEIDRRAVDDAVRWAMETYQVAAYFADVALWESYVDQWSIDFRDRLIVRASSRSSVGWDMRRGLHESTRANERLVAAIGDGAVKHSGQLVLRRHVLNARRRVNAYGVSFGKEHRESSRKVDGYSAMLLADMARTRVLESGQFHGETKVLVL
ncbi:terminase [Nocardia terpenica]|nr:terminase [Nocardia terpenica]MBF6104839.1 terminase [Nocardia terpenica]MBF6112724.1 terminase [Nocardia terpenica]MBF6118567.1 terminase [Nocardia terpenica]MBF6155046.1 terminase [Nocardia terpenica]